MDGQGRVVIPADFRRALRLEGGDTVVLQLRDGVLHVLTRETAIRRAQELVARHTKGRRSLVDDLIAERRAQAAGK